MEFQNHHKENRRLQRKLSVVFPLVSTLQQTMVNVLLQCLVDDKEKDMLCSLVSGIGSNMEVFMEVGILSFETGTLPCSTVGWLTSVNPRQGGCCSVQVSKWYTVYSPQCWPSFSPLYKLTWLQLQRLRTCHSHSSSDGSSLLC